MPLRYRLGGWPTSSTRAKCSSVTAVVRMASAQHAAEGPHQSHSTAAGMCRAHAASATRRTASLARVVATHCSSWIR
jgi:hypothetical protein